LPEVKWLENGSVPTPIVPNIAGDPRDIIAALLKSPPPSRMEAIMKPKRAKKKGGRK